MSKITLNNLINLQNETSVVTEINANNATIVAAFDNTLSRDGTSPNPMLSNLDMNSHQILNLPAPATSNSPVRLQDLATIAGGGTVQNIPTGGSAGQVLTKNSGTSYDTSWQSQNGLTEVSFITRANAIAATIFSGTSAIQTLCYTNLGDGGGSIYTKTAGSTLGGFQSADGAWWTPDGVPNIKVFGVTGDGTTNDGAAIQNYLTAMSQRGLPALIPGYTYNLGGLSLAVPDSLVVECSNGATLKRTAEPADNYATFASAFISLGNRSYWRGGILNNTSVVSTSSTSVTIGTGVKVFTVTAGLPWFGGQSVRVVDSTNALNYMEGVITSIVGTTLTLNIGTGAGTGLTRSSWNINEASVYQCPMIMHGVFAAVAEDVQCTGLWYGGFTMDGWNPSSGAVISVLNCTYRNCYANNVQNRGFYYYGTCADCTMVDCSVIGGSITNYGFNYNPTNASGFVNSIQRCNVINGKVVNVGFQGYAISEQCYDCQIVGCSCINVFGPGGTGYLMQVANTGGQPQFNKFIGCKANACQIGFQIYGCLYCQVEDCTAVSTTLIGFFINGATPATQYVSFRNCSSYASGTQGFEFGANSIRCSLQDVEAINNGGGGINIDAGAFGTIVNGRSQGNAVSNYSDLGTGTVLINLTTA